ncbi:MAG: GumC family protein, partial [Alphaproteobacteria bacterium]
MESGKQNVVDIDSVAQGLSNDYYTQETQAAVLSSRELAAQIVDRLNLTEHPLFTGEDEPESAFRAVIGTVKTWLKGVSDAVVDAILPAPDVLNGDRLDIDDEPSEAEVAAEEAEWREDVIDYFLSGLEITPSERSRVITIEYISTDPEFAALAANTLAEVYILDQLNRKTDVTRQATAWLDTRVEDLRQRLVETKRRLEEFRRDSGYVEVAGTSVLQTQLAELSADLSKARTARAEAEARASQVGELMESEGGLETAAAVLDSTLIQRLREQEAQVARKIAELRTQLRDGHPKLDLATNELKELRDSIQTEVVKIARNLENEAELARVREANIENELERLRVRIDQQSEAEVTIRALETEVEANERLYETMLTRLKETRIQDESLQQADARIISRAVVPGR